MKIPFDQLDPTAWLAYADYCQEHNRRGGKAEAFARKTAKSLQKFHECGVDPRACLVGSAYFYTAGRHPHIANDRRHCQRSRRVVFAPCPPSYQDDYRAVKIDTWKMTCERSDGSPAVAEGVIFLNPRPWQVAYRSDMVWPAVDTVGWRRPRGKSRKTLKRFSPVDLSDPWKHHKISFKFFKLVNKVARSLQPKAKAKSKTPSRI